MFRNLKGNGDCTKKQASNDNIYIQLFMSLIVKQMIAKTTDTINYTVKAVLVIIIVEN